MAFKPNPIAADVGFTASLYDPDGNRRALTQMVSVDIIKDYINEKTDKIIVTANVGMGTFIKWIHPKRNNLDIVLVGKSPGTGVFMSARYHAIIVNNEGGSESTAYDNTPEEELNKAQLVTLRISCVMKEYMGLRTLYSSGVYYDTNVKDVIKTLWNKMAPQVKIDGKSIDLKIDMTEPNNDNSFMHMVLPADVDLFNLADYLQGGRYGVYNGQMCNYISYGDKGPVCTIVPLFDSSLYDKAKRRLLIKKSNSPQFNCVEDTWEQDKDGNITMLCNTNAEFRDSGDTPNKTEYTSSIKSDSKTTFAYSDCTIDLKEVRVDASNHTQAFSDKSKHGGGLMSVKLNTDNQYKERTQMMKNNMQTIQVQWNFAHPGIISPGMPCSFMYNKNGQMEERKGTVLNAYYLWKATDKNIAGVITIGVEKSSKFDNS